MNFIVIWESLGQDGGNCVIAGVCSNNGREGRVKVSKDWCLDKALLMFFECEFARPISHEISSVIYEEIG